GADQRGQLGLRQWPAAPRERLLERRLVYPELVVERVLDQEIARRPAVLDLDLGHHAGEVDVPAAGHLAGPDHVRRDRHAVPGDAGADLAVGDVARPELLV